MRNLLKEDGGVRGWIVVLAGFVIIIILSGVRRSMGLIFLEVLDMCDAPRSTTSLIVSCYFFTAAVGQSVVSFLLRRFSTRSVIFSGGLLASGSVLCASFAKSVELFILFLGLGLGAGHACAFMPTMVLISHHFKKHRTLAVGICGSGSTFGALLVPLMLAVTSERYAGPGMLMFLSGLNLHLLVAATLMRSPKDEEKMECEVDLRAEENDRTPPATEANQSPGTDEDVTAFQTNDSNQDPSHHSDKLLADQTVDSAKSSSTKEPSIFCQLRFYQATLGIALNSFSQPLSFYLIPLLADDAGIDRYNQSVLLLAGGLTDVFFRVTTGLVSDRFPSRRFWMYYIIIFTFGCNWAIVTIRPSFVSILIMSLIQNAMGASHTTLMVSLLVDIVGLSNLAFGMSGITFVQSPLLLSVPPAMASIRESTGEWRYCCYVGSGFCLLSALVLSGLCYNRSCKKSETAV